MRVHFLDNLPKQYYYNYSPSGINIVKNQYLERFKECLMRRNSEQSVEGLLTVLNETPINKNKHNGINFEITGYYGIDATKSLPQKFVPQSIRCSIWRDNDDYGTSFDITLQHYSKGKNGKRKHYTSLENIFKQILKNCVILANGVYDYEMYQLNNLFRDLFNNSPPCK